MAPILFTFNHFNLNIQIYYFRFELTDEHLRKIEKRMVEEIHRGLNKNTNHHANIKSFITYVTQLPTGKESGRYLALDLGGTNFRVLLCELISGSRSVRIRSTKHTVSKIFTVIYIPLTVFNTNPTG